MLGPAFSRVGHTDTGQANTHEVYSCNLERSSISQFLDGIWLGFLQPFDCMGNVFSFPHNLIIHLQNSTFSSLRGLGGSRYQCCTLSYFPPNFHNAPSSSKLQEGIWRRQTTTAAILFRVCQATLHGYTGVILSPPPGVQLGNWVCCSSFPTGEQQLRQCSILLRLVIEPGGSSAVQRQKLMLTTVSGSNALRKKPL